MPSLSRTNPFAPTSAERAYPTTQGGVRAFDAEGELQFKGEWLWVRTWDVTHANAIATHRYPGVPGQTVEPLGREPWTIDCEAVFFGENWNARRDNVLFLADAEQTSGPLVLPDGRTLNAFLISATESETSDSDGCTVRLQFVEDAHVDTYFTATDDPVARTEQLIPTEDEATCGDEVDTFMAAIREPEEYSTQDVTLLLSAADAAIVAAQAALDLSDADEAERHDNLLLARYYMRVAAPSAVVLDDI